MISLAALEGVWRLERQIEDRRAKLTGHLTGEARWVPDRDGLLQIETGLLHYGDAPPMQAERRYLWRDGTHGLEVSFEDGCPFHKVDPTTPEADHFCAPDSYRVRYELADWPRWSSRWRVTGPHKDAVIFSRYSR
ncbi:DUF6314 family protein [Fontisubflavum oceani]|uniref:DUF6314 family protein n=1 Tax=Fontisubflavum oceani TaxID=2978973 RepID=UPI0025B4CDC9|nr:DUF6314 family protein [Fontisubflavum oceani]WJY21342.1 DUF6314 family protein [Fontisubflavum oceani]